MANVSIQTIPERWQGELVNVMYDLQNNLFLTPDNLLAEDGDPRRIDMALPDSEDGVNIYAGTSPQDLVRQNTSPIPFKKSSWQWTDFTEDGAPAPDTAPSEATSDFDQPKAPKLKTVSTSGQGFSALTYNFAYFGVDAAGNRTNISPPVSLAVSSGQIVQLTMPLVPASWSQIGFAMSSPSGSPTYWIQDTEDLSVAQPGTITLNGPFSKHHQAPTYNETYNGQANKPSVYKISSTYTLHAATYQIYALGVTLAGDTLASPVATYTVSSDQPGALEVFYNKPSSDLIGWRCLVIGSDGRSYAAFPANGNPNQPLDLSQGALIYSTDPTEWPVDSSGHAVSWDIAQFSLPVVDASGLADPIDPLDQPAAISAIGVNTSGSTATYYVAVTTQLQGVESPRGVAANILVAPSQSVRVIFPKKLQKIANATLAEQNSSNNPLDYTISTTNGTITPGDGSVRLFVSTGNQGATNKPFVETSPVIIDRTSDYRIHGTIAVDTYNTGSPVANIHEYATIDGSGASINTALTFETGNTTITGNGTEEFARTILSSDNFWQPTTLSASVAVGFASTASFGQTISELEFLEQSHRPETAIKGDPAQQEADNPDAPITEPVPEGPDYSPRKPKKRKKPQKGRAKTVQDRPATFGGSTEKWTFDVGASLSGLALVNSPNDGSITQGVGSSYAVDTGTGAQGWQAVDTVSTREAQVYYYRDLGTTEYNLGQRIWLRVVTMPTTGFVDVMVIMDESGAFMGTIRLGNGTLDLCVFDRTGTIVYQGQFLANVTNGSIYGLELSAQGAGTSDGHLRAWVQVGTGGTAYVADDYDGVDWTGFSAQRYAFGIVNETANATTANLNFDTVIITPYGQSYVHERDVSGNVIYQGIYTLPKKHKVMQNVLPHDWRIAVKPNQTYVFGIWMRTSGLKGIQQPFFITLYTLDGGVIEVGSIAGPNGISGDTPWREYIKTFTTPDKCFEMRVNGHDIGPGKYVFQEICMSEGAFADAPFSVNTSTDTLFSTNNGLNDGQLARVYSTGFLPTPLDQFGYYWVINSTTNGLQLATLPGGSHIDLTDVGTGSHYLVRSTPRRTGLRAALGSFRATLNTGVPNPGVYAPLTRRTWLSGGVVVASQDPGTAVNIAYRSSDDLITYYPLSGSVPDFDSVPQGRYLEVSGSMMGDGIGTPVIGAGSPFVNHRITEATLLREDGSEFDGGTILLDLQAAASITPTDVRELLNRHIVRFVLAAPVGEVAGFKLQCFTESARREIMETWMTNQFLVEGRGRSVLIKPKEQVDLKQVPHTQLRSTLGNGEDYYYVYASGDVTACEVVSEAAIA